jgi:hypothetical protein
MGVAVCEVCGEPPRYEQRCEHFSHYPHPHLHVYEVGADLSSGLVERKHWQEAIRERDEAREAAGTVACVGPWMWSSVDDNDLDSMGEGMVVSMTAGTLRQLLAKASEAVG